MVFLFYLRRRIFMDSILGILFNLFEGLDLAIILESIEGSLVEYDVSSVLDTLSSFYAGLFH
jgi:hypothetical protein